MESQILEGYLNSFIFISAYFLEFIGAIVILSAAFHALIQFLKRFFSKDDIKIRIVFASRLALALEFKVGAEILRTVLVRSWEELAHLAAIIVLRAILNIILHLEIDKANVEHIGNPSENKWWSKIKNTKDE